ncbi:PIN domain-containing protein [Desulfofustis glycolicus]|uniref:PIN domain-containing protein n=1 Tax=Desulfofustis glycolicus TaxID=51195 RepID=UPI0009332ABE|nr:PIN domain-containing protein [Desulfofustis glycolicus]
MHIFLDSNIFFNNWKLNNPNFQHLFNFINNNYSFKLLSKLVVEETENNRRKQVKKTNADLQKSIKEYNKLNDEAIDAKLYQIKYEDYSLYELLAQKTENIKTIDYSAVSHEEVVERALNVKKPFLAGEKGYRDTLIWLSFLY